MKHVTTMGGIWQISERQYRNLRRDIRVGLSIDLDNYGKLIITDPEPLADLIDEIKYELESSNRKRNADRIEAGNDPR